MFVLPSVRVCDAGMLRALVAEPRNACSRDRQCVYRVGTNLQLLEFGGKGRRSYFTFPESPVQFPLLFRRSRNLPRSKSSGELLFLSGLARLVLSLISDLVRMTRKKVRQIDALEENLPDQQTQVFPRRVLPSFTNSISRCQGPEEHV